MANRPETSSGRSPTSQSKIDGLVNALMAYEPEKIILFGSAARGDTDEYSDIDLVLIKETDTRFVERLLEAGLLIPKGISADVFVYTPSEFLSMIDAGNPFIGQVLQDGQVLYETNEGDATKEAILTFKRSSRKGRPGVKKPLETARRWLAQAEHSLSISRLLLESGMVADACFHSEQTAQLALKAFLYPKGRRFVNIHSVRELASVCGTEDSDFSSFEDYGMFLDRYYLSTRYPDALPAPAVPFESFTQEEAEQAVGFAEEIVALVQAKIPVGPPESA